MNRQIIRLSGVAMVLLAALIAATTYWQTWARADLAAKQDNAIQRVAQFSIRRGAIEAGGDCSPATAVASSTAERCTSGATRSGR